MDVERAFEQFLLWEAKTRDTIDFKKAYVDMADDLVAGLLLSQIVFWTLPDREGRSKIRVFKGGHGWIVKRREDWWEEIRITSRQFDRAVKILEDKHLLITALYKFDGAPTKHVRIDEGPFLEAWNSVITQSVNSISRKEENPSSPKGEKHLTESARSLTETTTEIITETFVVGDVPEQIVHLLEALANAGIENPKRDELAVKDIDPLWVDAWALWTKDPKRKVLKNPAGNIIRKLERGDEPPAQFLDAAREQRRLQRWEEAQKTTQDGADEKEDLDDLDQEESAALKEANRRWSSALSEMERQMTRATFDTWLRGSKVVEVNDNLMTVGVRYAYAVDWLENRLYPIIEGTVRRHAGADTEIAFVAFGSQAQR